METTLTAGYKTNTDTSNGFGYIISSLAFAYKLEDSGQLVLATKLMSHITFGDDFEFYHEANIVSDNGLR